MPTGAKFDVKLRREVLPHTSAVFRLGQRYEIGAILLKLSDGVSLPPPGRPWASANRRSFLKNGDRAIHLELGCEGNSPPNQAVGVKTGLP